MEQTFVNFGEHLMIDGYQGNHDKLNDKGLVSKILDELPIILDMEKLSTPEVYYAEANDLKDCGGWSGFVVIVESHISVHTFPKKGFVSIDVYTCKNGLNVERIVDYFKDQFNLQDAEINFVKRGTRYPVCDLC